MIPTELTRKYEYYSVTFPATASGENKVSFASTTPIEFESHKGRQTKFELSQVGRAYITHAMAIRDRAELHRLWGLDNASFIREVNKAMTDRDGANSTKWVLSTLNGQIFGLLTRYNPVSNLDILNTVVASKLADRVWRVSEEDLRFEMMIHGQVDDNCRYGLVVRNGNTGHVAMSYKSYWRLGEDYLREFPEAARSRHLSTVAKTFENFSTAVAECLAIEVDAMLNTKGAYWAKELVMIKLADDDLLRNAVDKLDVAEGQKAIDFLVSLNGLMSTRGLKGRVRSLIDVVVSAAEALIEKRSNSALKTVEVALEPQTEAIEKPSKKVKVSKKSKASKDEQQIELVESHELAEMAS